LTTPRSITELKQLLQPVLDLPQRTAPWSAETYRAIKPLQAALTQFVADIWKNTPDDERASLDRCRVSMMTKGRRKNAGTGVYDTPEETWEEMRAASMAGETFATLARRFGVLPSAIVDRRDKDGSNGKPWRPDVPSDNADASPRAELEGPPRRHVQPGRPAVVAPHLRIIDGGQPPPDL